MRSCLLCSAELAWLYQDLLPAKHVLSCTETSSTVSNLKSEWFKEKGRTVLKGTLPRVSLYKRPQASCQGDSRCNISKPHRSETPALNTESPVCLVLNSQKGTATQSGPLVPPFPVSNHGNRKTKPTSRFRLRPGASAHQPAGVPGSFRVHVSCVSVCVCDCLCLYLCVCEAWCLHDCVLVCLCALACACVCVSGACECA